MTRPNIQAAEDIVNNAVGNSEWQRLPAGGVQGIIYRFPPVLAYVQALEAAARAATDRCYAYVDTAIYETFRQGTACMRVAPEKKCPDCQALLALIEGSIAERHMTHYRNCNCLGGSDRCCDSDCPCHVAEGAE